MGRDGVCYGEKTMAEQQEQAAPAKRGKMACPVCDTALVMSERQNIEIDYCPQCRGVWLDRGELDKIIERSLGDNAGEGSRGNRVASRDEAVSRDQRYGYDRGDHGGHGSRHGGRHGGGHGGRYGGSGRGSWLRELFD
jgi:hypothetical protein